MTSVQKTSSSTTPSPGKAADSSAPTVRLEQQQIASMWISEKYEVWKDGCYKRKVFSVPADVGTPPVPNLYESCPTSHLKNLQKIAGLPAYLSGMGHRVDDAKELLGITYLHSYTPDDPSLSEEERAKVSLGQTGEKWETIWVPHGVVANAQNILKLADDCFPVRTSTAKEMSDFLTDCYYANVGLAQKTTIVRRVGHHQIGENHGWLVGQKWIGSGKVQVDINQDKMARGLRVAGDEKEWLRYTQEQWALTPQSWILRWSLGVAATAPLLRFIGERTFFVHHYGITHGAKTTAALLAQSFFGHPLEFKRSLNQATQNSLTEILKYVSDLPLLLDELQGKSINASDFIMQACSEEHKTRSKAEGGLIEDGSKPWRTIIRTTGEQPLAGADKSDAGGQATRTLEFRHPGLVSTQGMSVWKWLAHPKHYGHSGVRFLTKLQEIVNDPAKLSSLEARFIQFNEFISSQTGQARATERQLGAIALGEYLMLHWIYGWEKETAIKTALRDAVDMAKNWLRAGDGAIPVWSRAVDYLIEHRSTHANLYADALTEDGRGKLSRFGSRSFSGIVAAFNAGVNGNEVWYFPSVIDGMLKLKFELPASGIWEQIADKGYLDRNNDRLTKMRQIKGIMDSQKVYVVDQTKLNQFNGGIIPEVVDMSILAQYSPCGDEWEES